VRRAACTVRRAAGGIRFRCSLTGTSAGLLIAWNSTTTSVPYFRVIAAKTRAEAVDLALSLAPAAETVKTVERTFRSLR
jgi:hypothetical protein